jgi:recombination protein RecT
MANIKDSKEIRDKLAITANNQIDKKENPTIFDMIKKMTPEIERALPKQISGERMTRIALTVVRNNPKLQLCNPISFIAALMQASQLGLEPNTPLGEAYIIPYGNEVQFQIGYKGLLELANRSGKFKSIYAHAVYSNDTFEYNYGLFKNLKHIPADEAIGEPIYYYAVYHLQNGGYDFVVWSRKQIEKHRDKYSFQAQSPYSPWSKDFGSMAKKTVLKDILKYAPKSIEFARAFSTDETIKNEIAKDMTEVIPIELESGENISFDKNTEV